MDKLCRACLRFFENLTSLEDDQNLIIKIEAIAQIQMLWGAGYPSNICEECVRNVKALFNFRKVIINNDKELHERSATLEHVKVDTVKDSSVPDYDKCSESDGSLVPKIEEPQVSSFDVEESAKEDIVNVRIPVCDICNETFSTKYELKRHKRKAHVKSGVCNVCGLHIRLDNLNRHVTLHSADPVECDECGKVLKNFNTLRTHKQVHRGIRYTCEICGKIFTRISSYHTHCRHTHRDPELSKTKCKVCGKRLYKFGMKRHMYSHTGDKPYRCKHCTKGFTSSNALKVHTRQHTNEKPYSCHLCPMRFPQKVSLSNHIKSKHADAE